ncbi:hypothetical protein EV175_006818 [Coemansia sp. RSA 1933]|nr:hypothetical protein EV175_006818 [Coemansia sp. RSA 1933]
MKFTSTVSTLLIAASAVMATDLAVWKITDLDSGDRANLCDQQIQTCQNNCGGPDQAPMAFCNPDTLGWGCGCKSNTPTFDSWNWPVPARDCTGSLAICKENCGSESGDRNQCFADCSTSHQCNTKDAPISYTNTTDVNTPPAYVGPAVSYSGKDLGDLNDGNDRSNTSSTDSSSGSEESSADSSSTSSDATSLFKSAGIAMFAIAAAVGASSAF